MIGVPSKAIKKFTKEIYREIVSGILLAYGLFPSTNEGVENAKKFVAGLNEWIAPSDLPNYYDGIDSDLMTGKETAGIINIRNILKEFYFGNKSSQEPEDIPIELEIVEVEQKEVNEPVVIRVEAPFDVTEESPLRAPKRVRLPKIKNTIKKKRGPSKNTVGQRMAEAFEKNLLDPLVDSIVNPPTGTPSAPATPKQRKKKESLAYIKTKFKPSTYQEGNAKKATTFEGFLGAKIGTAFKNAAIARKEFVDMGGSIEDLKNRKLKDRFITKALGFEFGGDKIARTRGFFAKNPDASMDPALSRGQRFRSGISPLMSSTLPVKKPEEETVEYNGGLGEVGVAPDIEVINKSYNDIMLGFSMGASMFDSNIETTKVTVSTTELIEKKIKEINELLSSKTETQKKIIEVKQKEVSVAIDAIENDKTAQKEKQIEETKDTAGVRKYIRAEGGLPNILGMIRKLIGKKGETQDKENNIINTISGLGAEIGGEIIADKIFKEGTKRAALGVGATAAIVGGAGLAASALGEGLFKLTNKETGAFNETLKGLGTALDATGAPFRYAIEAIRYPFLNEEDREKQAYNLAKFDSRVREYSRSWMNRIDFMNIIPDQKGGFGNIYGNESAQTEMMDNMGPPSEQKVPPNIEGKEKFAEGTAPPKLETISGERVGETLPTTNIITRGTPAMVGEAGKELVGTEAELSELIDAIPDKTSLSMEDIGADTIIGVAANLIKQSGNFGARARPFIKEKLDPLIKGFGIKNFTFPVDIGKGAGELNKKPEKENYDFGFGGLLNSFLGLFGIKDTKGTGGGIDPGFNLDLGGGQGRTTANAVYQYLKSKGLSEFHAKGIVANISRESGFKIGAHNPNDPNGGSIGLFQWNAGRAQRMMAAVPNWQTNWQGQIDYALQEDHGPTYLSKQFNSAGEAAYDWMKYWERPAEYIQNKYTPEVYEALINKMSLGQSQQTSTPTGIIPAMFKQQGQAQQQSAGVYMPPKESSAPLLASTPPTPASPTQPSPPTMLASNQQTSLPYGDPTGGNNFMILPIIQTQTPIAKQQTQNKPTPGKSNEPASLSSIFAVKNGLREVT